MGKRTTLFFENATLTTGTLTLAAIQTAAANAAAALVEVTRIEISQRGSTSLQFIGVEWGERNTSGTLTMTATTPANSRQLGGPASGLTGNTAPAGGAARTGTNASVDTGGTFTPVRAVDFANTNGYMWKPDPDEQLLIPSAKLFYVRFLNAPTTLTGWSLAIDLDESV